MEELMNVDKLSEEEKLMILRVIKRDEELRKAQDTRVSQLKTEIHNLRMQSILREGDDLSKICARCHKPFGFFFNTGDICSQCKFRVCSVCRESLLSGKWLCILCYKHIQLKGMTGEWIYGDVDNEQYRKSQSGADVVKASLRKSLSTGNVSTKPRDRDGGDGAPDSKRALVQNSKSASQDDLDRVGFPKDSDKKRLSSLFDSFRSSKDELNDEQYEVKHVSCRRHRDTDSESDSGSSVEGESPMDVADSKSQSTEHVLSAPAVTQNLSETESASEPPKDQRVSSQMLSDIQVPNQVEVKGTNEAGRSVPEELSQKSPPHGSPPMTPTEAVIAAKKRSGEPDNLAVHQEESSTVSPVSPTRNALQTLEHKPLIVRRTSSEKSDSSLSSARTASPATKMRLLDLASKRALERESFDQEESGSDSPRQRNGDTLINDVNRRHMQHGQLTNGSSLGRHDFGEGAVYNTVEWRSDLVGGGNRTSDLTEESHNLCFDQAPPSPQITCSFMHKGPFHAVDTEAREITPTHVFSNTEHESTGYGASNMPANSCTTASANVETNALSSQSILHDGAVSNTTGSNKNNNLNNMLHLGTGEFVSHDSLSKNHESNCSHDKVKSPDKHEGDLSSPDTTTAMSAVQNLHQDSLSQLSGMATNTQIPSVTEFFSSPVTSDQENMDVKVSITSPEPSHTQITFNISPQGHSESRQWSEDELMEQQECFHKLDVAGGEVAKNVSGERDPVDSSMHTNQDLSPGVDTSKSTAEQEHSILLRALVVPVSQADMTSATKESQRPLSQSSGSESLSPHYQPIDVDIGVSELVLNELNPKFAMLVQTGDLQTGSDSSLEEEFDVRDSSGKDVDVRLETSQSQSLGEVFRFEDQLIDLTSENTSQIATTTDVFRYGGSYVEPGEESYDPFDLPRGMIADPSLSQASSELLVAETYQGTPSHGGNQLTDLSGVDTENPVFGKELQLIDFTSDPMKDGNVIVKSDTFVGEGQPVYDNSNNDNEKSSDKNSAISMQHGSCSVQDFKHLESILAEPDGVLEKESSEPAVVSDSEHTVIGNILTDTSQIFLTNSECKHPTDTADNLSDSDVTISDLTNSTKFSGSDPSISSLSSDTTTSVLAADSSSHSACQTLPLSDNITSVTDSKQLHSTGSYSEIRGEEQITSNTVSSVKPVGVGNLPDQSSADRDKVVIDSSDHICQDTAFASANSPQPETCSESDVDDIEVSEFPLYASPNETEELQQNAGQTVPLTQMEDVRSERNGIGTVDDMMLPHQKKVTTGGQHDNFTFESEDILETKSEPSTVRKNILDDTVPDRASTPKHQVEAIDEEQLFQLVSMSRPSVANTDAESSLRRGSKDDSELVQTRSAPSAATVAVTTTAASSAATVTNLSTIGLVMENDEGDPFASESVSVNVREAMQRYLDQDDALSDCLSVITERTEPEDDSDDVSEISKGLDDTVEDEDLDKEIEKIYQANLNIDTYLSSDKFGSGSASAAIRKARQGQQRKHIEEILSSPILNDLPVISEVVGEGGPEIEKKQQQTETDKVSIVSDNISAYLSDMSSVDHSNRQTPTSSEQGTDEESDAKSDIVQSQSAVSDEQDSAWFDMSLSVDSVREVLTPKNSCPSEEDAQISGSNETLCDEELPQDDADKPDDKPEKNDIHEVKATPLTELPTENITCTESVQSQSQMKKNENKQIDQHSFDISDDYKSDKENNNTEEISTDKDIASIPTPHEHGTDVCSSTFDTNLSSPHQITSPPDLDLNGQEETLTLPSAASPASQLTEPTASAPDVSPQVKVTSEGLSDETESHGGDSGHISGTSAENTPEHRSRSPRHSHLSIPSLAMTSTSAEEQASQQDEEDDEDIDKVVATHKSFGSLRGSYGNLHSNLADSRESLYSVYSDAGEINYGKIPVTGEILFGLDYNYKTGALEIYIKQCKEIAPVDTRRNRSDPYVKTYLLPDRTRGGKRKTKIKKHTLNPTFDEVLRYVISKSEVENRVLWVTVWHSDRFGRNDFLGEVLIALDCYKFGDSTPVWYPLQERLEAPSSAPVSYKGDLVLSVKYVTPENIDSKDVSKKGKSKKTKGSPGKGELQVLIKEARNLSAVRSNGSSDPFCKAYLLPEKNKSSKQKTPVVKRNCNPTWNHVFLFEDISLAELKDRSLELTVWDYDKITSNDFLGGIRLNLGTGVSGGRKADWMDARGEEIAIWQSTIDRPNCWNDATVGLRASMGKSEIRN